MARFMTRVVLLSTLFWPPMAHGQFVEDDETEALETTSTPRKHETPTVASAVSTLIVGKTNQFRVAHDRKAVEVNPRLAATAEYFASYMAKNDKYGHTADGNRPSERAKEHGYDYCIISENIAYQYSSLGFATEEMAARLEEGWENSPGHRQNMLDPDVMETGVAVARSDDTGYWYAVQMFGRPASAAVEFKIANQSDAIVDYTVGDREFQLSPHFTRTHSRCRNSDVTFEFPEGQGDNETVQPKSGDRYQIIQENGQLAIRLK